MPIRAVALPCLALAVAVAVSACATSPDPPLASAQPPPSVKLLVCDAVPRDDMVATLRGSFPSLEYAWEGEHCQRAIVATSVVSKECGQVENGCDLPDYVDGERLADPASPSDVAFVLAGLNHEIHRNTQISEQSTLGPGAIRRYGTWRYVVKRSDVETAGLTGPVYLFSPRKGTIVGARHLHGATAEHVRDVLVALLRDTSDAR